MSDGLSDDIRELLAVARYAAGRAYAPYSGFAVGCALRCKEDGAVFTGCNVENASYGLTLCAERVAATTAISAGRRDFDLLAIYAEGPAPPMPCGACRQVLAEFAADLAIATSNGREAQLFRLDDLLPHAFGRKSLPRPS